MKNQPPARPVAFALVCPQQQAKRVFIDSVQTKSSTRATAGIPASPSGRQGQQPLRRCFACFTINTGAGSFRQRLHQ
jgi:hypothetical protein